jgi:hypothetical protein
MFFGRHSKRELSVLALLCTLGVFLVSAPVGPYSAVHGPVTALRALQASVALLWAIAAAALKLILTSRPPLAARRWLALSLELAALATQSLHVNLRC